MKGIETRNRVYQAAMGLANRDGLLTLTLENVAAEAGLSKGGILHHFPNKEALLLGVIEHFAEKIDSTMTRLVAEDPNPSFRWIRAMIHMSDDVLATPIEDNLTSEGMDRFMLSILAVAVHNPDLLKPIHAIGQRLRGRLTANPEEGLEQILMWLVFDGLFLWRFVGLVQDNDPLHGQVLEAMKQRLLDLTGKPINSKQVQPKSKSIANKTIRKKPASLPSKTVPRNSKSKQAK
jgi:AcrR family transcriptional regulator